ncbi:MAG: hypothetical protein M1836_007928 [Candelina mexicana]|nr:MAG: hypothetical protein M1836_007928 [Candelina mexicana]
MSPLSTPPATQPATVPGAPAPALSPHATTPPPPPPPARSLLPRFDSNPPLNIAITLEKIHGRVFRQTHTFSLRSYTSLASFTTAVADRFGIYVEQLERAEGRIEFPLSEREFEFRFQGCGEEEDGKEKKKGEGDVIGWQELKDAVWDCEVFYVGTSVEERPVPCMRVWP